MIFKIGNGSADLLPKIDHFLKNIVNIDLFIVNFHFFIVNFHRNIVKTNPNIVKIGLH